MGGICVAAAHELLDRLTTAGTLIDAGNDPYPAYMMEYGGVIHWPMYVSTTFMSDQWENQRHQIVVHELIGHYVFGYSDAWMSENDFGSECNPYNRKR